MITLRRRGGWLHGDRIPVQPRMPLTVRASHESVVILEPQAGGPVIERTRRIGLPNRRVMPLAESRGAVAVLLQHLGYGDRALGPDGVVTGEAGCALHDGAKTDFVIVT